MFRLRLDMLVQLTNGIFAKCEHLQEYGSYKIRGIRHLFDKLNPTEYEEGFVTISAGNMARALCAHAQKFSIKVKAYIPNSAPQIKIDALIRLNCEIVYKDFDQLWQMVVEENVADRGFLVHPLHPWMLEGYGTIGQEIYHELPEVDALVVPYGCGGLLLGIARYFKERNPRIKIVAAESSHASPLSGAKSGLPMIRQKSFIDAIGAPGLLPKAKKMLDGMVDEVIVVSETEVKDSIKKIYLEKKWVIEGAAGVAYGAARAYSKNFPLHKVVVILSGGNIDPKLHQEIIKQG